MGYSEHDIKEATRQFLLELIKSGRYSDPQKTNMDDMADDAKKIKEKIFEAFYK